MNRRAFAACLAAFLAGCAGGDRADAPVTNVFDICRIYDENPHWAEATAEAAARWGTPPEVKMAIIWRESAFRAEARPPFRRVMGVPTGQRLSSAYGFSQAIDGTWAWYLEEADASGARRNEFSDAIDFVGWYMNKTADLNRIPFRDAFHQYLAYHEGHAGFRSGRWRGPDKAWLRRAAAQVAEQAERYRGQLSRCGGRAA